MTDPVAHGLAYIRENYGDMPAEPGWYEHGGFIIGDAGDPGWTTGAQQPPPPMSGLTVRRPDPMPLVISDQHGQPILTIHPDGRVTLDQPDKADEAAHTFADTVTQLLTSRTAVT